MHKKARHAVVKMLGIGTLTFLLSWLPLYCLYIMVSRFEFAEKMRNWEYNLLDLLYPLAQWLGSSNSCVNPVLYAFLNKQIVKCLYRFYQNASHFKDDLYYRKEWEQQDIALQFPTVTLLDHLDHIVVQQYVSTRRSTCRKSNSSYDSNIESYTGRKW